MRSLNTFPILLCALAAFCAAAETSRDWPQFGGDVASSGVSSDPAGITAANVGSMVRHQVQLSGVVDSSAIYLHDVTVKGAKHNVFFMTTAYGKTLAVDADQFTTLWEYVPPQFATWDGTNGFGPGGPGAFGGSGGRGGGGFNGSGRQIVNGIPAADPDRLYIYAAAPDGIIRKIAIADGSEVWATPITLLASREKMDSAMKVFKGRVYAVTAGYAGDRPPYQGHIAILDAKDGKLLDVWNSLCSDKPELLQPDNCAATQSAIWGRSGAVIDPATGDIFFATGNGPWDGKTSWADALIELNPDATKMVGNYTPTNNEEMRRRDLDMGSTSPALLGNGWIAQGGKDKVIRVMTIQSMAGTDAHSNDSPPTVPTPSGNGLLGSMVVWHHNGDTLVYAADRGGAAAWTFKDGRLNELWKNTDGGNSPVLSGGMLFVYDPKGALNVYDALKGTKITSLEAGKGHWNSPIVVDGKIALPEGGQMDRDPGPGVFDIWTLPGR